MSKMKCRKHNGARAATIVLAALFHGIAVCTAQTISATQQLLDFGDVAVNGFSDPQTVTLINYGDTANLNQVSIQVKPGSPQKQFTIIAGGNCSNAAFATTKACTFLVKAQPTVSGQVLASIVITATNVADGVFTSQPILLSVNGVVPQLTMKPALDFGDVVVGTTSLPQLFSIINTGTVPAVLSGATLQIISGQPQFNAIGGRCQGMVLNNHVLAPGDLCTVTVTATPTAAGKTTQQFVLTGPAMAPFAAVTDVMTVNGIPPTLPQSPALRPPPPTSNPPPPALENTPPPPPPHHHHHSGK